MYINKLFNLNKLSETVSLFNRNKTEYIYICIYTYVLIILSKWNREALYISIYICIYKLFNFNKPSKTVSLLFDIEYFKVF